MIDFGKWAFSNRKLVLFLVWCLILGGVVSYNDMSKLEDPAIKVKQALIVTTYPGASAHEVELEVSDVLEKSIRQMPDIESVQSQSMNDLSLITVELKTTVQDADIEQHWDILRRKVQAAQASLPQGSSTPAVKDDFGDVYGMFYALTGDGLQDRQLSDYAELIKREVSNIDGVSRIDIYGKRNECINISLLQEKMTNLGVKPAEVIQTLNGQNKAVYSGYFDNGNNRIRVNVSDKFKTVDDISKMIIQGHEDDQLRLSDIASITKDYATPTRNEMFYDGQRSLGISISAQQGTDILKVGAEVEECMENLKSRFPAGVEYHKVFYQPERVSSALNTFIVNLIESVLIVVLVLIFSMGFKSGVIIGASLVVIVLGSIFVLNAFDGTLQRVSLAAFILAMGMLVDNAIVIMDGILVDLKTGKPRMEALTDIGLKNAFPLLGATLIAILAFLPIFMSPDTAGVYVRDLFIVMGVSLLLSWILALTHVPLMADRLFKDRRAKNKEEEEETQDDSTQIAEMVTEPDAPNKKDLYGGLSYRILGAVLNFTVGHKLLTVCAAIGLLALSAFCYRLLPQGFFPDMEYDQLYMEYKLPEGTNSTQVQADLDSIRLYLTKNHPEVTHVTTSVGGTPSRYNLVRSVATPSLAYGELIIDFETPGKLVDNIDKIQDELSKMYPQAYIKLKRYNLMYKKYPIEANFMGPDPEVLHQLADSARRIMEANPNVELITTDWEPKVPVLTVNYLQPEARRLGLSRQDIGLSLLSTTDGLPIGSFYEGIHKDNIYVKCLGSDGKPIQMIEDAYAFSMLPSINGLISKENLQKLMMGKVQKGDLINSVMQTIPLKQTIKDVEINWEDPVVLRWNGQRAQRVQCSPAPGVGTEAARASIAKQVEAIHLPEGYSLSWEGEKKASSQAMKYLFKNFPLSILLMIAILILLFKDYKKPAIIFCCIPFILVGVIPAMLISGKTFGFVAIVGVLGLIGMMIKNAIVLMNEIMDELAQGTAPKEALIHSSMSRLRPVMMASLTTILGMVPLLPDAMFGSLAATIMGGLLVGTIITLVFIPTLYALIFKLKV